MKHKFSYQRWVILGTFALFLGVFMINLRAAPKHIVLERVQIAYGYDPPPPPPPAGRAPPRGTPPPAFNTSAPPLPLATTKVQIPSCGNGFLDTDEECDLGARLNGIRTCSKQCTLLFCGDDIISAHIGEECEPQQVEIELIDPVTEKVTRKRQYVTASCGKYCIPPTCDEYGKKCTGGCRWKFKDRCPAEITPVTDDDFTKFLKRFSSTPSVVSKSLVSVVDVKPVLSGTGTEAAKKAIHGCGNGIVDASETCDQAEKNSDYVPNACRSTCQLPICGDGVIDPLFGEICDQGIENSNIRPSACRLTCTPPICGDGVIDSNEECDGGDECSIQCQLLSNMLPASDVVRTPLCGDGQMDNGEECDDKNSLNNDGCSQTCRIEKSICGNTILDEEEGCDDGNSADGDGCSRFCVREIGICGNGIIEFQETCDEGPANSDAEPDHCRSDCEQFTCGDGVIDSEEECDDGNDIGSDACSNNCELLIAAKSPNSQTSMLMMIFIITSIVGFIAGTAAGMKWFGRVR